jgi:hypothetical protein
MDKYELEKRTKQFALRIIQFAATLPAGRIGDVIGYQLVKAGHQSAPTIGKQIAPSRATISSIKSLWLKRKVRSVNIGWKYATKPLLVIASS